MPLWTQWQVLKLKLFNRFWLIFVSAPADIPNSSNSLNSNQSPDNNYHDNLQCTCSSCSTAYHASRLPCVRITVPPYIISMANYEIERERRMESSQVLSTFGNRTQTQMESNTRDIPPSYQEIEELPPSYENYQFQFEIRGNNSWLENSLKIKAFDKQNRINRKVVNLFTHQSDIKSQQILNQKDVLSDLLSKLLSFSVNILIFLIVCINRTSYDSKIYFMRRPPSFMSHFEINFTTEQTLQTVISNRKIECQFFLMWRSFF